MTNSSTKIMTVIGARPQFVKAAPISAALKKATPSITEVIVHTGQHFDHNMSDLFFEEMMIPRPDHFLEVRSSLHGEMTGVMMTKIEKLILAERPDAVMVYGDTNSTLAGALAASKLHVPVVHIEAGLRSHNWSMPEEVNRVLTDRISTLLFCPNHEAKKNLEKEGIFRDGVEAVICGDVMLDAALLYGQFSETKSRIRKSLPEKFVLCTIHRANNTDNPERIREIFSALKEINRIHPVILPLHPRTRKIVSSLNLDLEGLQVIEPVGYFDMLELLKASSMVLTDSGGMQKEAYFFGKPCVTLRDETEWTELIDLGVNSLAGAKRERILSSFESALKLDFVPDLAIYGGGKASEVIVSHLDSRF